MNEYHFDHTTKIYCRFLETGKDAPTFFQPPYKAFNYLSCNQVEAKQMTIAITKKMNFATQTASTAAKCMILWLVGIPLFPPPAAHRTARTIVPSIHHNSSFIASVLRSRSSMQSRLLFPFHLSNRSHTVHHGPISSGKSRQGAPVFRIHKIPSTIARRS